MIPQQPQQGGGLMAPPQDIQPTNGTPPVDPDVDGDQDPAGQADVDGTGTVSESTRSQEEDMQIYLARGLDLMSSERTRDSIMVILKAKDPVRSLADALLIIMRKIDGSARGAGIETSDTVKVLGSHQLIVELAKIATASRVFTLDEPHVELAFATAVQDYIKDEISAGRIDGEKLASKMQTESAKQSPEDMAKTHQSVQRLQDTAARYKGGAK